MSMHFFISFAYDLLQYKNDYTTSLPFCTHFSSKKQKNIKKIIFLQQICQKVTAKWQKNEK